ncbi:MAG: deoxyhypusine synthase family protein [Acidobacteriota bacterium]|nr:deoxyhypusine synthase family protein [Acidobacteriota bacterium]MDQ3420423.1 deoxyhypusine synthase family protein [Acidobacteriota bacterium]
MKFSYEEFDLSAVRTYPLASRKSKANAVNFARVQAEGSSVAAFVDGLPAILAGADLKAVVSALRRAREAGAGVIWGIGAHVIKTGLSPVLIDLMERGYVSALATNGAGIIHDFELALSGSTSEDVEEALGPGRFGMAEETATQINAAIADGVSRGMGLGQSVCSHLASMNPPHAGVSLLSAAARLDIPVTVHVAIGTDIIHMHPAASGAAIGEGSLRDFRYFVANVARLQGGVYLNCGSAVVLPEVFLKAVALARNTGASLDGLTTVNIDFMRMYRPQTNVVTRPVAGIGKGYSLVGHHEILIPLIAAAL